MKSTIEADLNDETLANTRAVAAAIDREVLSGRTLADVLDAFKDGQRFWLEVARPFSKAIAYSQAAEDCQRLRAAMPAAPSNAPHRPKL